MRSDNDNVAFDVDASIEPVWLADIIDPSNEWMEVRHMTERNRFSCALVFATVLTFASSRASAGDLRLIQEDRVRTVYACGADVSPKLFKWFKEWEAYRRWDEGNPRASNVLALIDEDEFEAIADPSKNKIPAIGCKAWLDQHLAAGEAACRRVQKKLGQ